MIKISPKPDSIKEVNIKNQKFDKDEWENEVNYLAFNNTTQDLQNKVIGLSKFGKKDVKKVVNSSHEQYEEQEELDKSNASIVALNSIRKVDQPNKDTISEAESAHASLIQKLINEIMSRMNFKYTFKDILLETILKCKCKQDKQQLRKKKMFYKAIRKIDHEFDAVNLMKTMKQVRLMQKVIMNQTQNLLMGFQYKYVLDPNQNEVVQNDSDSDVDVVKTIKKMRSGNNLVRIFTSGKIKKQLMQYLDDQGDEVKDIDKRLLNGIFPISHKEKIKQQEGLKKQKTLSNLNDNYETKHPTQHHHDLMSRFSGSQISLQDREIHFPDRLDSEAKKQKLKNETMNYFSVKDIQNDINSSIQENDQTKHVKIVDQEIQIGEYQSQILSAQFNSNNDQAIKHDIRYKGIYSPQYIRSLDNSLINDKFENYY
eukprot:403375290